MSVASPLPSQEHRFPCENCGSDLRYAPQTGALSCEHCGFQELDGTTKVAPRSLQELDFKAALADSLPDTDLVERRITPCESCGAQIEFESASHAAECPFCATPVVVDTGTQRQIKPKGVLPFQVEETNAHDAMSQWLGRLWFAPSGLKEYARKGRKMRGIYVPYWTFDAQTQSQYQGARGSEYQTTTTHVVDGKTERRTITKVRWKSVAGRVARAFDDILILASHALPKSYTQALEPWDLSQLEPYQPQFLAGFSAEGYTLDLDAGFELAREKIDRQINRDVRFDIGGDRQRVARIDTQVSDVTFKHILLPVWLAAYKYRGKTYRFVVNGQNGHVQGERPYSLLKILFASAVAIICALIVGYFAAQSN